MAQPTYFPDWANDNTNLPATGNVNKVRPKTTLRTIGWDLGELPSAEEWNWQLNNIGLWVHYLNDEVVVNLPNNYLPKNGTTLNFNGDITGTATWNGTNSTGVTLSSAMLSAATSAATPNTLVKRDNIGAASFGTVNANIANANTLTVTGTSTVAAITTTSAQGPSAGDLTRKDYVDTSISTLNSNLVAYVNSKTSASGAANGWFKDNNTGIIIQWGSVTLPATGARTTSNTLPFATTFPTAALSMITTPASGAINANGWLAITSVTALSTTGATVLADSNSGELFNFGQTIRYLAIGY